MGIRCLITVKDDGEVVPWLLGANEDVLNQVGADCAERYPTYIVFIAEVE